MAKAPKASGHTPDAPVLPAGGSIDFNALNDALAAGVSADKAVADAVVSPAPTAIEPEQAPPAPPADPAPDDLGPPAHTGADED